MDVFFNLIRVSAAVDKDLVDASICKKLKRVFDQWGVGERKQTLRLSDDPQDMQHTCTYARTFQSEWAEACLE